AAWLGRPLILTGLLLATAASCQRSTPGFYGTTALQHPPGEIWVNNATEPEWIDPGKCAESAGSTIVMNTFAGLTQPHPKTLQPMPEIARTWAVSDQGRRYTFWLRPTQWSDGHALTAHDFVYSWKRVIDPTTGSKYNSFLYPLENAEAFGERALWFVGLPAAITSAQLEALLAPLAPIAKTKIDRAHGWAFAWLKSEGTAADGDRAKVIAALNGKTAEGATAPITVKIADASVVGVRAIDDDTLELRLEHPVPYFLSLIMFYTAMPVPRHVLERLEKEGKNPDLWTRPEYFVSNGPYVLKEWKFRQYMVLEKNPYYWDAANVRTPRIRLLMVDDENTLLNLYKTGQIDYIGSNANLPVEFLDYLRQQKDFVSHSFLAVYYYWINTKLPPLDDARVRRALGLAIDRPSLTRFITRGNQIPTATLVPDGLAGYQSPKATLFDPAEARRLLKEAGYDDQHPLPHMTLIYNTQEGHRLIAQAVQQMWKKHLGLDVDIENLEWKVYLKKQEAVDFQISRGAWIGDYPDPFTFLELLSGTGGNNHSNWRNAEYDRLLTEANRTLEAPARMALLRKAEDVALAQSPMLPIYVYTRNELVKPYLRGFWGNIQNHSIMKYWHIDERFYKESPAVPPEDPPPPMLPLDPVPAGAIP
ncbi:MAG: oligopeptide transport system substrate-binding protein, partial [Myxococcales bacterium]|nr:oligopeptide transport system substrate-binding protein [Myxococcales bacterium]